MEKSANKYTKIADKKYEPVGNFINYYIHNNKVSKAQMARDLGISLPAIQNLLTSDQLKLILSQQSNT